LDLDPRIWYYPFGDRRRFFRTVLAEGRLKGGVSKPGPLGSVSPAMFYARIAVLIGQVCRFGQARFDKTLETNIRMKYMLLTYLDEKAWFSLSEAQRQENMAEPMRYVQQLIASGTFLGGSPLDPSSEASTVRLGDGKPLVTDGPFAETREQVGGYTIIDAEDREEAIAIATRFLGTSSLAIIEVRRVAEMEGVPSH
jgi:hypothetical protein